MWIDEVILGRVIQKLDNTDADPDTILPTDNKTATPEKQIPDNSSSTKDAESLPDQKQKEFKEESPLIFQG